MGDPSRIKVNASPQPDERQRFPSLLLAQPAKAGSATGVRPEPLQQTLRIEQLGEFSRR
jgi:hypothetical protein